MSQSKTKYICQLSAEQQNEIKSKLQKVLNDDAEVEIAMAGRLCDIEELFLIRLNNN